MDKSTIRLIVFVVLMACTIIALYVTAYYSVYEHELVHKKIYEIFGCKNITIRIHCGLFSCSGVTYGDCKFKNKTMYYWMESLHTLNEVVAYNIDQIPTLFGSLFITLLTAMYLFEEIRESDCKE